ncbi:hypothetical protein PSHT_14791 [Puccinia striiformis]|uniref:Uncharacterized protein n=1 Tax=Puccinia striiformis TaxID=27350 RepID=A0A2S4UIL7_9BASI|nr:hypothetical protein PSHT_14791 [Puccinia striiformis]
MQLIQAQRAILLITAHIQKSKNFLIVQLSRMFYDKLPQTSSSINQLLFKLDAKMSSDELDFLLKTIKSFYRSANYMTCHFPTPQLPLPIPSLAPI